MKTEHSLKVIVIRINPRKTKYLLSINDEIEIPIKYEKVILLIGKLGFNKSTFLEGNKQVYYREN